MAKSRWRYVTAALAAPPVLLAGAFGYAAWISQRADYGWQPEITQPAYTSDTGPTVAIDHAHHNASTANWWGRLSSGLR